MKKTLPFLALFCLFFSATQAQVIWSADPNESTNVNDFFRRFDGGNYPSDYCYTSGDQAGVDPSNVTTTTDQEYGKVWKVNKPMNRKRGEFARTEGDVNFYAPAEGDDIYIGWRWKINTEDGNSITDEVTVWQWKSAGDHDQNYPLNMEYDGDLTLNAWGPDYANNSSQSSMRTVLWRKAVPQDTWVSLVVRIKVDKDDFGGLVQFWFNGEPQVLENANFNKYQVNLSSDKYTAYHRTNDGSLVYPKWGIYNKKSCSYNASAYFNEFKIGTSLNDAMPSESTGNQAPSVAITSPSNNANYTLGETISLTANASDPDGNLEKVNFKIDDGYYSNDRNTPFTGSFTPSEAGTYKIAARAFDYDGAYTEEFVTITVAPPNQAPQIEMLSPTEGEVFYLGDDFNISTLASDDVAVTKVNFKVNGKYHSQDVTDNNGIYTGTVTPTAIGEYTIGARVFDAEGESMEVSVTIEVKEEIVTHSNSIEQNVISVQPNPSTGIFNLKKSADWSVYNLLGEIILSGTSNKIDLSQKTKGSYFLKVNDKVLKIILE